MADMQGWWSLHISEECVPSDADLEHIGSMIIKGYTSGQLVEDEE